MSTEMSSSSSSSTTTPSPSSPSFPSPPTLSPQYTSSMETLPDLPLLRDSPSSSLEALFKKKLALCSHVFSFAEAAQNVPQRDKKRQTLLELVDHVNTPAGQKIFTEATMPAVVSMVKLNIVRSLPKCPPDFDPEEDEPNLEPAWPHLQVVYEFFLRFVVSGEVNAKAAKKFVDQSLW